MRLSARAANVAGATLDEADLRQARCSEASFVKAVARKAHLEGAEGSNLG